VHQALSGAGYSGPNNEIVWGSVKWQHHNTYCGNSAAGVANETTADYLDFFVNETKLASVLYESKIFFSTTEDALIKTNGCGTVQVSLRVWDVLIGACCATCIAYMCVSSTAGFMRVCTDPRLGLSSEPQVPSPKLKLCHTMT
jgi:hypothetical protein